MPPKTKKGAIARFIDKVKSTPFTGNATKKGAAAIDRKVSNTIIMAQKRQQKGTMYNGSGKNIPITVSAPSVSSSPAKSKSAPSRPKVSKVDTSGLAKKGLTNTTAKASDISSSPVTTRKTAGKNTGRLAQKASKLRSKGEAALESGNLAKSKRLRRRYDRQTAKMNKSMSNASSGYGMKPGSKNISSPTTFNNKQQDIINEVNKNFNFKNDI